MIRPNPEPPATIAFEINTARRVGAQLRYNSFGSGRHLAEIRAATRMLAGWDAPRRDEEPTQHPDVG